MYKPKKKGTNVWIYLPTTTYNYKYSNHVKLSPQIRQKLLELPNDPSWQLPKMEGANKLIEYAREWNVNVAKWFFFMNTDIPHKVVERIKQLQEEGQLTDAKYRGSGNRWQFLFYVDDFDNEKEVTAMMNLLIKEFNSSTINPKEMFFKPDIYTYAGIYSGNKWGITPWIRRYNKCCEVDLVEIKDYYEWWEEVYGDDYWDGIPYEY